jgi:DNA-binding LacI/PurR family transcriptional regulator
MSAALSPTIRTISELAGVSPSTVSRALKDDPRISHKTRTAIVAIAQEQGYMPNAMARGLVTRSSGVIGIVVGNMENPFYGELVERLHRRLVEIGKYPMLLHIGGETLDTDAIRPIREYRMDGCIIAAARLSSRAAEACTVNRLPMVMINRVARVHSCTVSCNNYAGGVMIGELLVDAQHERIAFIAGREDTSTSEDRESGLRRSLRKAGLELVGRARGLYTYEGGFVAAQELLASKPRPDAIFAANDIMALGAMDAIRAAGLKIPDEISVIGFDDIRPSRWHNYQLTTIAQPIDAMITRALSLLVERMAMPDLPGENISIDGELCMRASARLPVSALPPQSAN